MNSINLMDVILVGGKHFWYTASDLLFLTSTAWLLVLTPEMALRARLAGLNYSRVSGNLPFLSFVRGLCIVIGYMALEQVSATSQK
jgi:hypothetical protein